jgi:Domain of unknown function (DUF4345)
MEWLNAIGAAATILMGCLGLFFPARASALTGLKATTVEGSAEFRGTFGVFFILLGLVPLVTQSPYAFLTAGLAWLGAALGRVVSIVVDAGNSAKNWQAFVFECAFAISLLAGPPFVALTGAAPT